MSNANDLKAANEYWGRAGLAQSILDALEAQGKKLDALTPADLAPIDQFHNGGKSATVQLANLAELKAGMRVLDVGGGLGGPARTLAVEYGCIVTVVDPTESYIEAGEMLTKRLGLADRVRHRAGSGLDLPCDEHEFEVVWTQNSGMTIPDKEKLYAGFHRVLRRGGTLAIQEPMAGTVQPVIYPLVWARDESTNFLRSPAEMRALIEAAGFKPKAWEDATLATSWVPPAAQRAAFSVPRLVMGDAFEAVMQAGQRNTDEGRMVTVQAVFTKS